jgi:hypothetical protein
MWSLSKILSSIEGPSVAFTINRSILASPTMGHYRHSRQVNPSTCNYTFNIVAVEYFTKWIEVNSVTNISFATIKKLFWQNIIYRYGVPWHITVGNANYFDNAMFKDFCHQVGMKVAFVSVYHPQSNRAAERANDLIFEAIKKTLEGEKKANGLKLCQRQYEVTTRQSLGQQTLNSFGCCSKPRQYYRKRSSTEAIEQQRRLRLAQSKLKTKIY